MKKPDVKIYDLIVIGGGAAGFFGAIQAAEMKPGLQILILEKSNKILSKVKVSGGGRCNVTHYCLDPVTLSHHYPRGERPLRSVFKTFNAVDTVAWFEKKGVQMKVEDDGRMFPISNSSQTIIDCFLEEAMRMKIKLTLGEGVIAVIKNERNFTIHCNTGKTFNARKILIATGGNPTIQFYDWISSLGHTIISPIPSLFTFNDSEKKFKDLMGVSVPAAEVRIAGTKFSQVGPVLITHWGLSGPAVIKLSAWAAEYLHETRYQFIALISWIGPAKEEVVRELLSGHKRIKGKQKIASNPLFSIPQRLWFKLCELAEISEQKVWAELPQKNLNRLIEYTIRCPFRIKGKTTYKEEFVTCGGVDLKTIDTETMQSRGVQGIYFAGEVLNIDGETGGFNFQSAWSTAYLAAKSIVSVS